MRVSSRTPEGSFGRCPTCGTEFRLDPTDPLQDVLCPRCNSLVVIPPFGELPEFDPVDDRLLQLILSRLQLTGKELARTRQRLDETQDSPHEFLKLVMSLEDAGALRDDPVTPDEFSF